jgi:DNA-binding beta-propeller fold protein YncE
VVWSAGDGVRATGLSFGRIAGLAVDNVGKVYVADAADHRVVVLSIDGSLAAVIGRSGSGPGEFNRVGTIAIQGNTLLVRDEGNARMQQFQVGGKTSFMRTAPLLQFHSGISIPIFPFPDGSWYDEARAVNKSDGAIRPTRVLRSANGMILRVDTLAVPAGADEGQTRIRTEQKAADGRVLGVSERTVQQPFGSRWLRAYGPDGLRADVVSGRFEVRIYDRSEQLLATIRKETGPVAVTAREIDSTRRELTRLGVTMGVTFPKAKAPIAAVAWSRDGQLWVERAVASGKLREAELYDRTGKMVGRAVWPAEIDLLNGLPWIEGRSAWAVARDADDVERVVRLQFK